MSDKPSTYFDHARAAADEEAGGRFARQAPTIITGVPSAPLPTVGWARDHGSLGPEPPLGQRVDDVPNLGFPDAPSRGNDEV